MAKIFKYLIITIILIVIIMSLMKLIEKKYEANTLATNSETVASGMELTLLGGSNMEDKGNVNSMGYFILTANEELIFIDGGRDIDSELVKSYIDKYGNGKVDHWFITHPHTDHIGALLKLLEEENNLEIENIYYSFLEDEWYKENDSRGYETAHEILERVQSSKIKNRVECEAGQVINIDNTRVDIIRIANPEITNSDNGNDASMVFKITAEDVDKSVIFLGDTFFGASNELLKDHKDKLKADSVQMAHHGQNGATKEVYDEIAPEVCFYNCPKWLWDNDNGGGENSGPWKTLIVRNEWMKDKNVQNYVAFEGDQTFRYTSEGIIKVEE